MIPTFFEQILVDLAPFSRLSSTRCAGECAYTSCAGGVTVWAMLGELENRRWIGTARPKAPRPRTCEDAQVSLERLRFDCD